MDGTLIKIPIETDPRWKQGTFTFHQPTALKSQPSIAKSVFFSATGVMRGRIYDFENAVEIDGYHWVVIVLFGAGKELDIAGFATTYKLDKPDDVYFTFEEDITLPQWEMAQEKIKPSSGWIDVHNNPSSSKSKIILKIQKNEEVMISSNTLEEGKFYWHRLEMRDCIGYVLASSFEIIDDDMLLEVITPILRYVVDFGNIQTTMFENERLIWMAKVRTDITHYQQMLKALEDAKPIGDSSTLIESAQLANGDNV